VHSVSPHPKKLKKKNLQNDNSLVTEFLSCIASFLESVTVPGVNAGNDVCVVFPVVQMGPFQSMKNSVGRFKIGFHIVRDGASPEVNTTLLHP
jgi:hypothetical protein